MGCDNRHIEERENVLTIIEQIVELSVQQRKDFADMLKKQSWIILLILLNL